MRILHKRLLVIGAVLWGTTGAYAAPQDSRQGEANVSSSTIDEQYEALLGKLKARDKALDGLYLPFMATERVDKIERKYLGWWLYLGDGFSASVIKEKEDGVRQVEYNSWDGASYSAYQAIILTASTSLGEVAQDMEILPKNAAMESQTMTIQSGLPARGTLYGMSASPSAFGLMMKHRRWPEFLKDVQDVRPRSRMDVNGRDCLAVLFDRRRGENDASYSSPYLAYFDDKSSLLAVRIDLLMKASKLKGRKDFVSSGEPEVIRLDEEDWMVYRRWEVRDIGRLPQGVAIPTSGEMAYPHCRSIATTVLTIPLGKAALLQDPPKSLLQFQPPKGTDVHNEITGERYTVAAARPPVDNNRDGDWPTDAWLGYTRNLEEYAYLTRQAIHGHLGTESRVLGLSCGPIAVSLVAALYGKPFVKSTWQEQEVETTSVRELAELSERVGLACQPVKVVSSDIDRLKLPCIVHLSQWSGGADHFALAAVAGEQVHLYSPPGAPMRMTRHEFDRLFTGAALIFAPDKGALDAVIAAPETSAYGKPVLIGSLLLIAWSLWGYSQKLRKTVAA